eukprot:CAMPEP_0201548100 /NCGR_PEP_ID=MMETSP0173_2-20130828/4591_1 /ASSEMBLY_ACC=CAM_ASM_000268 /TAXON_ID=218659 /ORGANISM="Vexillifera sp., Strain DIVA3 564/2" /LENGTH=286 /DNA_ID=CAMNT_0047957357 /DNA_START=14 /DNA_END=871 /DNA_ORIENTATION=-
MNAQSSDTQANNEKISDTNQSSSTNSCTSISTPIVTTQTATNIDSSSYYSSSEEEDEPHHYGISIHDHLEHPELDPPDSNLWALFPKVLGYHTDHIKHVPNRIVRILVAASWNALIMALAEFILEVLMLASAIPKTEFRTGFTFLTLLSAVLGCHTLSDVIEDNLDTTIQAMRVTVLVEVGLILSDFEYIFNVNEDDNELYRIYYRSPFIVLTALNLVFITTATIWLNITGKVFLAHLFTCRKPRKHHRRRRKHRKRVKAIEQANHDQQHRDDIDGSIHHHHHHHH